MARRIAVMLVAFALGCRAREQPDTSPLPVEAPSAVSAGLDGRWVLESCFTGGELDPDETGSVHTFRGSTLTITGANGDGEPVVYEVVLASDTTPKEMDLIYEQKLAANGDLPPAVRKQAVRCIYKVEGDTLTICGSTHEQYCRGNLCVSVRPTAFASVGVQKQFLQVLKRTEAR